MTLLQSSINTSLYLLTDINVSSLQETKTQLFLPAIKIGI